MRPRLPSPSKYRNQRVRLAGETRSFDSKREAEAWQKLKLLEERGVIRALARQWPYRLKVNDQLVTTYRADFVFEEDGVLIVADAKGYPTPEYKIKKALMKAIHGIEIREL